MKTWLCRAAVGLLAVSVGWGLYQGLQGPEGPSLEEQARAAEIERLTERLTRQQRLADQLASQARSADSVAEARRDSLGALRARESERREEAKRRAARAGDSLRATLDSLEAVLPEAHEPLVTTAREQLTALERAHEARVTSLSMELAYTRETLREQAQATAKWRSAYTSADSALDVAERRADSLQASRDYWRGEARTTFLDRLFSGYAQAAGKVGAVGIACWPETGGTETCVAAAGMWAVDAVLAGLP